MTQIYTEKEIITEILTFKTITIMKTRNAIIVAMAAITGTSIAQESKAMEIAMQDMAQEYGEHAVIVDIDTDLDDWCA